MSTIKPATTYDEQVERLRKRGCIVSDEQSCKEKLATINYYRLAAYFLPFKQADDTYIKGTTFEDIYGIYEFDRKIRNILFGSLEAVEVSLKANFAYYHAHHYGPLGYMNAMNFNSRHDDKKFNDSIQREIENNKRIPFVKHHLEKYNGEFPIWVITELFTFGMLSYFYNDLKTPDQKNIARQLGLNYKDMISLLRCCTDLRNICAHYGRLYFRVFSAVPAGLNLEKKEERSLWGAVLAVRALYPSAEKWNLEIMPKFEAVFNEYTVNLSHIAFPDNWLERLRK